MGEFTPLVAASSGPARCERLGSSGGGPGTRAVSLLYDDPAKQRVTVILDAQGEPIRYTDVRGDLSESDDDVGDRTTIGLYLPQQEAYVSNRAEHSEPVVFQIPFSEALSAESLGNPDVTLERVIASCRGVL
jgi:hypothetical protein